MKKLLSILLATILLFAGTIQETKAVTLPRGTLNWNRTYQTIDGFGVSQAADTYAADLYNFGKRDEIMDLLFTRDKGIGLTILRCEVGNGLNMPTINPREGVWDYTPYEPEQWVIREGRKRGVQKVISTVWSPPAWMKTTGRIKLGGRLRWQNYQDYANYLARYIKMYRGVHGITIDAISIANEPEYAALWQSCLWSGAQFRDFLANYLKPTFEREGITTDVIVGEEGTWTEKRLYPVYDDPEAVSAFDIVGGHNYHGSPHRFGSAEAAGKRVWLTETSDTIGRSTGFKDGVKWSKKIHDFMTKANANAFLYWLGASYKKNNESLIRFHNDGTYDDAKRLYSMGNFSKFVRPGYVRMDVTENPVGNVYLTAYKNPSTGEFAIVAVNNGANNESFVLDFENLYCGELTPHITNDIYNLETMDSFATEGRSVELSISGYTTVTYTGKMNTPIPQDDTSWKIEDKLDDFSKIIGRTANWRFDDYNPYNAFEHDYSRAIRTTLTKEWLTYYCDNMKTFEAKIYYHKALQGLSFEVSSDGYNWTNVEYQYTKPQITAGYWERIIVTPKYELPTGTKFIKVIFDKGGQAWDKNLSEFKVR